MLENLWPDRYITITHNSTMLVMNLALMSLFIGQIIIISRLLVLLEFSFIADFLGEYNERDHKQDRQCHNDSE